MDPHPGSHTVAALDSNGSLLGSIKVPNTSAGLEELHQFASQFVSRRSAIEGAGNRFVAQFVNELLAKGETIYAIRAESDQSVSLPARNKEKRSSGRHQCGSGCTSQSAATLLTVLRPPARVARVVTGSAKAIGTTQIEPFRSRRTQRKLAGTGRPRRCD